MAIMWIGFDPGVVNLAGPGRQEELAACRGSDEMVVKKAVAGTTQTGTRQE